MMIANNQENSFIMILTSTLRVYACLVFLAVRVRGAAGYTESLLAYVTITTVRVAVTQWSASSFHTDLVFCIFSLSTKDRIAHLALCGNMTI